MARGERGSKRLKPDSSAEGVELQNRFGVLSDSDISETDGDGSGGKRSNVKSRHSSDVPPIIIDGQLKNHKKVMGELRKILKNEFTIKVSRGGKTLLRVKDSVDHKAAVAHLDSKYEFHSFSLKDEYQPNYVLSGLPQGVSTDEITEDLTNKGLNVVKVKSISKDDNPYPLYQVIFEKSTEVKKIFETKTICYCVITWSKYKSKAEITQCYRCMSYGHISKNCHRNVRCLKCAGNHSILDCIVDTELCANCGESHKANDKNCKTYIETVEIKNKKTLASSSKVTGSRNRPGPRAPGTPMIDPNLLPPRRPAWPRLPGTRPNHSSHSEGPNLPNPSSSRRTQESPLSGFSELKDLLKFINIPKLMLCVNSIGAKLRVAEDTFSKIIVVVEGIFQLFE